MTTLLIEIWSVHAWNLSKFCIYKIYTIAMLSSLLLFFQFLFSNALCVRILFSFCVHWNLIFKHTHIHTRITNTRYRRTKVLEILRDTTKVITVVNVASKSMRCILQQNHAIFLVVSVSVQTHILLWFLYISRLHECEAHFTCQSHVSVARFVSMLRCFCCRCRCCLSARKT